MLVHLEGKDGKNYAKRKRFVPWGLLGGVLLLVSPPQGYAFQEGEDLPPSMQERTPSFTYEPYTSLGLVLSSVSGIGLGFRLHLPNPLALQVAAGSIYFGIAYLYAVGGELQWELSRAKQARFYLFGGAGVYGGRDQGGSWNNPHVGGGIGGELALGNMLIGRMSMGATLAPLVYYHSARGNPVFTPGGSFYLFYNF